MPTTLSTLPRELRDEIYSCIFCPTGIVALIPRRETSIRRGGAPVTIIPCTQDDLKKPSSILQDENVNSRITLALLRTCRFLNAECRDYLFRRNVFFFRDALEVERVMDEMGQTQSRRIENMVVDISKGLGGVSLGWNLEELDAYLEGNIYMGHPTKDKFKGIRKLVRKSLSRSRAGSLKSLSLRINGAAMMAAAGVCRLGFDQLLAYGQDFGKQFDWGNLKRSVEIWMDEDEQRTFDELAREREREMVREKGKSELDHILLIIHMAWKCDLLWNGTVLWEKSNVRNPDVPQLAEV